MNFYKHHLGDYAAATSHLAWDEDCAYRRLIDHYYKREAPIPADIKDACRLARAQSPVQRRAVETVLREFFILQDDGWHQKRCDEEITAANAQADTNRRIAEEREAKKRARIEHESLHDPSNESSTNRADHQSTNRSPAPTESVNLARLQTPDSRLQTEIPDKPDGLVGSAGAPPPCPVQQIVAVYHEVLPELPKVKLMPSRRRKALQSLWRFVLTKPKSDGTPRATSPDEAMGWIRTYFERAHDNDWLMGRTPRVNGHENWQCDLDFLLSEKGLKQVIEKTREQQH